jgi:hypothetical protein
MGLQYENFLTCLCVWCVEIDIVDHCYEDDQTTARVNDSNS